jgi:hypothetical protein
VLEFKCVCVCGEGMRCVWGGGGRGVGRECKKSCVVRKVAMKKKKMSWCIMAEGEGAAVDAASTTP